jgi:CheY-like chemotaxis protein/HPt (histidine-containing phosphotransfer) domain-containing protein
VDDNEVNRFVAVEQLQRLGYEVAVAHDGEEAVQAVLNGNFAAVLMDCQMPVMDGYEATARIRLHEGTRKHTPIVALTAHALTRERDRCLAAGMDDYLTKPVRSDVLRRALGRVTSSAGSDARGGSRPPPAHDSADVQAGTPVDELLVLAPVERSARLIELFLTTAPRVLAELLEAAESRDTERVRTSAHKLKGSCLTLDAPRMAELARRVELAAERGDLTSAGNELKCLREHFNELEESLRSTRSQRDAG